MKNKIIGIIGSLIIVFSIIAYFAFDNTLRQNSELFGKEMIVFSKPIKAGQIISEKDLTFKRIKRDQIVPEAIIADDKNILVGKVALIDMKINEQLLMDRFADKNKYYSSDTRLTSFPTNVMDTVASGIKPGDYVDIWVKANPSYPANNYKEPTKLFSNVRIEGLKNETGGDYKKQDGGAPAICIVRLNDEQIKILKTYAPNSDSTTFITLYPNQVQKTLEINK